MIIYNENDTPYVDLANAIIAQAAEDYRRAMRNYKQNTDILESLERQRRLYGNPEYIQMREDDIRKRLSGARHDMAAIERFFFSPWAKALTGNADMGYIVRKLRKEYGINGDI